MKTTQQIETYLKAIIENESGTIRAFVCKEALDHDNAESFFRDLARHGCVSGMVNSLIYYKQTFQFFDEYYDEIEIVRIDHLGETGEPLRIDGDLKNGLVWFAFEQTAFEISSELEMDL
jgi:hypothetical protein